MNQSGQIKSTIKHALIYSFATFLQKGAGFIMLPLYAHYLGGEGYGIVGMLDVLISLLTVVVGYGLAGGMQRLYFEKKSNREQKNLVSTAIIVTFFTVLIVCLPAFLLKTPISSLLFGKDGLDFYLTLAILTFFVDMTAHSAAGYILIKQQSFLFSLFATLKLVLALTLNVYFIVYLELGILGFLYSGLISGVLYSVALHLHAFINVGFHFSRDDAKDLMKYNFPLIPGFIAMFLRSNADRVILRSLVGLAELGSYNMLLKFAALITLFIVQPVLRIWTVKQFEVCDQDGGAELMARIFTLQLALMLLVGLVLSLEIPLILRILTPPEFWVSGRLAFLAVTAQILFGSYYHMSFGLAYEKKTYAISLIQIATALLGVSLNITFIYLFGFIGALISSVLAYLFQCVVAHLVARKYYKIPFEWMKIFRMVCAATVLFFLIDNFSVSLISLDRWIDVNLAPLVTRFFEFFSLDGLRNGKVLLYLTNNLPVVIDGVIKFILSFSYIVCLFVMGIFTKSQLSQSLAAVNIPFFVKKARV